MKPAARNAVPRALDGTPATSGTTPKPTRATVMTPSTNVSTVRTPVRRSKTRTRRPSSVTTRPPVSASVRGGAGAVTCAACISAASSVRGIAELDGVSVTSLWCSDWLDLRYGRGYPAYHCFGHAGVLVLPQQRGCARDGYSRRGEGV